MRRLIPLLVVLAACAQVPAQTVPVHGQALAGPVCPVENDPPDPACVPRPVTAATVVVRDSFEAIVATATTGADGGFTLNLPRGEYTVVGLPVPGLTGNPPPVEITVKADPVELGVLAYDTGIR